jgi:hypothetical protein
MVAVGWHPGAQWLRHLRGKMVDRNKDPELRRTRRLVVRPRRAPVAAGAGHDRGSLRRRGRWWSCPTRRMDARVKSVTIGSPTDVAAFAGRRELAPVLTPSGPGLDPGT